ncbi:MAG: NAD-dependent epimerase/dehydratase family protein [Candidatus Aenigmarchaeota archaeon]|nr:NAD-dependent epimerase/dehydratase family protein [Candidatus Aenigmarchaeota archaeon]
MESKIVAEDVEAIAANIASIAAKFSGRTILITGAAGFLGSYLVHTLEFLNANVLREKCRIIAVDNFLTGKKTFIADAETTETITHDIRTPLKIDGKVDYIIHAAGLASPAFYNIYKIETLEVGSVGTKNMLDMAREKNAKSILFLSSSEVYGDPHPEFVPTPETYNGNVSCTGPRACYDESKRMGEALCMSYYQLFKVPIKIVRIFNAYGPHMRFDDYRVLPNFISSAMKGNPLPIYRDGSQTRTFCYVTDIATGLFQTLLSEHNGEVFNLGNQSGELSMYETAKIVAKHFGGIEIKQQMPELNETYRKNTDPKRRCPDISKIRRMIGYEPKVTLDVGIPRMAEWFKEAYASEMRK